MSPDKKSMSDLILSGTVGGIELLSFDVNELLRNNELTVYVHEEQVKDMKAGDHVFIKEGWRVESWDESMGAVIVGYWACRKHTNTIWRVVELDGTDYSFEDVWVQVSDELESLNLECDENGWYLWEQGESPISFKKAKDMPDWASRIKACIKSISISNNKPGPTRPASEGYRFYKVQLQTAEVLIPVVG